MIELICGFIGVIIGGVFSLITTVITVKSEKSSTYNNWLRQEKIQTYKNLSNVLAKIDIAITNNGEYNSFVFDSKVFKEKSELLYQYTEEHLGELNLFLPLETYNEIIKFKGLLYKIISSDYKLRFDKDSFKNKNGIAYELVKMKTEIIKSLQNDLRKGFIY